jgi:hypothetical protein
MSAARGAMDRAIVTLRSCIRSRLMLFVQRCRANRATPAHLGRRNQPTWSTRFVRLRIKDAMGGRYVTSVKRFESASPATGSAKAHALEQKALIKLAFA